jgi:hypothetical protein
LVLVVQWVCMQPRRMVYAQLGIDSREIAWCQWGISLGRVFCPRQTTRYQSARSGAGIYRFCLVLDVVAQPCLLEVKTGIRFIFCPQWRKPWICQHRNPRSKADYNAELNKLRFHIHPL